MFLIPLLSLLGAALLLSRLLALRIELIPVQVLSAALVVLYAAMLARLLPYASFALILAGGLALAYEIYRSRGAWRTLLRRLLTPGMVLFVVFYCVLYAVMHRLEAVYWDEFSHWALLPKLLLSLGYYPLQEGVLMFRDYAPGSALVQYLFAKTIGQGEGDVIFAHGVFMLAALLTLFAPTDWRRPLPLAAAIVLALLLPYYFGAGDSGIWSSLYVDRLVALLFVSSVAIYWLGGADTRAILAALPVLAGLPLVKEAGALFALATAGIIAVDQGIRAAFDTEAWRSAVGRGRARSLALWSAVIAAGAVPVLFAKGWTRYIAANGVATTFDLSPKALSTRLRIPEFGTFADEVVKKFAGALAGAADTGHGLQPVPIGLSPVLTLPNWLLALGILVAFCLIVYPSIVDRARILLANAILAAVFALYTLLLLVYYVFAFLPSHSVTLPSFARYLGSFILGWILVNVLMLLSGSASAPRRPLAALLLVVVGYAAWHFGPPTALAALSEGPRGEVEQGYLRERRATQALLAGVKEAVPESKRIYLIWNRSTGFPFYIARYELAPRAANVGCFGLGPPRYEGDIWSCDYGTGNLAEVLQNYDFVFLGAADRPFWERFASLFEAGAEQSGERLFRVEKGGSGPLLRAVGGVRTPAPPPAGKAPDSAGPEPAEIPIVVTPGKPVPINHFGLHDSECRATPGVALRIVQEPSGGRAEVRAEKVAIGVSTSAKCRGQAVDGFGVYYAQDAPRPDSFVAELSIDHGGGAVKVFRYRYVLKPP